MHVLLHSGFEVIIENVLYILFFENTPFLMGYTPKMRMVI